MTGPRVTTNVVGFTAREWRMIRTAAIHMDAAGETGGTLILPGRPEIYRLHRTQDGFELRLTDAAEMAEVVSDGEKH